MGEFTTFRGTARLYLMRMNPDGTLDTTFSTEMDFSSGGATFFSLKQPSSPMAKS